MVSKIEAKLASINADRASQATATIESISGDDLETSSMWKSKSKVAYYRAVVSEFLHNGGVEGQGEEARYQYLISDLWAVMSWR